MKEWRVLRAAGKVALLAAFIIIQIQFYFLNRKIDSLNSISQLTETVNGKTKEVQALTSQLHQIGGLINLQNNLKNEKQIPKEFK